MVASGIELLEGCIADLEAKLNLTTNQPIPAQWAATTTTTEKTSTASKKAKKKTVAAPPTSTPATDQPDICKLEFKVGVIVKVWTHPEADKLYCEEIDVGEDEPRQIASGLRPHYTQEQMLGQRLLVMSNLKPKKLVGFKSHGMVLCAVTMNNDGTEKVEFVEPPANAKVGEVIQFEGLPSPQPWSAAQIDKKKVLQAVAPDMVTTADGTATWKGHVFMTSAGPCKAPTVFNGMMR
jgi:aminoacyl tRNA synthase complex-interacting multifunctional protein 1